MARCSLDYDVGVVMGVVLTEFIGKKYDLHLGNSIRAAEQELCETMNNMTTNDQTKKYMTAVLENALVRLRLGTGTPAFVPPFQRWQDGDGLVHTSGVMYEYGCYHRATYCLRGLGSGYLPADVGIQDLRPGMETTTVTCLECLAQGEV